MEAAKKLGVDHPRGVANRVYYALYAKAHAELIHMGIQPRKNFGTWTHEDLPFLARCHLGRALGKPEARNLSRTLRRARQLRELADYRPLIVVGRTNAIEIIGAANAVLGGPV